VPVSKVDEALELNRAPVQPVEVPRDDGAELAGLDVGEHPRVGGPRPSAARARVVIDVLHRLPAAFGAELQAVVSLAGDGQPDPSRSRDWRR
jgi:hypothetical protein